VNLTMRPYQTEDDYWRIRAFLRWVMLLNGVRENSWHVAWYCRESQRVFLFSYATNPEVSDQGVTAQLQEHLDSFGCHARD
jgi:hypothetical protein